MINASRAVGKKPTWANPAHGQKTFLLWVQKTPRELSVWGGARNAVRCAGREDGAFRRRWFLRGGGARKKAAGMSKKCAWSRSERQPFCGGLALNDWRAGGRSKWPPRRNVPVCVHCVPTCLPLQVSVVRCKAASKLAQRACALSPQLRSELPCCRPISHIFSVHCAMSYYMARVVLWPIIVSRAVEKAYFLLAGLRPAPR